MNMKDICEIGPTVYSPNQRRLVDKCRERVLEWGGFCIQSISAYNPVA